MGQALGGAGEGGPGHGVLLVGLGGLGRGVRGPPAFFLEVALESAETLDTRRPGARGLASARVMVFVGGVPTVVCSEHASHRTPSARRVKG